ncbi:MAG: DUF748 domain-containing protein [Immundisolibacter sp.]|uniref:DUF748 domain-containing protein n=1 Tax=Immundisolibacter sp. TaxID=1934948 RepID=UPI003D0BC623
MRDVQILAALRRRLTWPRLLVPAVLAALVAGALAVPEQARRHLEKTLADATGGTAQVAALHLSPWRLAARVDGVYLTDPSGALLLAADAIGADLAIDSLWTRSVHMESVVVRGARGRLALLETGVIRPQLPPGDDAKEDAPLPRLRVDRVDVAGSALAVRDDSARPAATLALTDVALTLSDLDTAATEPSPVHLRGRLGGGTLRLDGALTPAPFALRGTLALAHVQADPALAYVQRTLPVDAAGGQIDAAARLSLGAGGALRIEGGQATLRGTTLSDADAAPLARIGEVGVDDVSLDLAARRVAVGAIHGRDNWLAVTRAADGNTNLQALAAPPGQAPAGPAWQVTLGALTLTGQRVSVRDDTVSPALAQDVTLDEVHIGALGSAAAVPVRLLAHVGDKGTLALDGTATLPAGPADIRLSAKALPLVPFAAYLPDLGPLALRSGTAAAEGQLTVGPDGAQFKGGAKLSRVELWDTGRDESLLSLRTFRVDNLVADNDGVTASKIWINRPTLRAIVTETRETNLARFGPRRVAPVGAAPPITYGDPTAAPLRFRVDTVRVSRGVLNVEDHSLTPHFALSVQQLKGDVTGLASDATAPAHIALTGRVDQYAPAAVQGSFTVAVPREAAFKLSFAGVEMATFAPYVQKFAGYRIERGTLDVDLDYTIKGTRVRGKNAIVLDRLVLGERVDSPDAVDLPLTLALAVLKDSRGVIDVALPLRGDLSNPQFDYGALIGMAIRSLLVKAVNAPFSLLAKLVGSKAADLRTVSFGPGSTQLAPTQVQSLGKVAQALVARPQLALEIRPQVDSDDSRVLAEQALAAALGQTAGDESDTDEDTDWTDALWSLYEQRFGSEPPPVPPPAGTTPSRQEQRAAAARAGRERLLAALAPDAAALRALGQTRGEAIRAALVDNGVPVGRLAIVLPPEGAELPQSASSELALGGS